ncbi:acetyl-CoA hydrolase/transferase family protein [Geothrix sp. PMB-07]|uniref:acetyl-CoA hydrolase/transferase family protein n=1 Tax=Geothrix sp. PMB-07 TaxID=3068640 RepID=UPI0027422BC8|nr:acetyl-CoA hydrolase/transferase C-terminal domain-containing protein [Geothrix sp. PMB-07]WLT31634.1 acetyl-CoA hydrolase/transferase C-terminal domain-containing protein [Geothrix sp. PMB-07]
MDWQSIYQSKLTSAEEAVRAIQSGQRVVVGHAAGAPQQLLKAMVAQKERYQGVEMVHMLCLGDGGYLGEGMEEHFRFNGIFVGANNRKAVEEGRGDYTPCFFHEFPKLFQKQLPVDVALIQVSRPDENGFCSFGVSCDYTKPAAELAKVVIAEANDRMPYIGGDNLIHVSKLTHIVETSVPILELPLPKIGETEKKLGEYVASLVEDGSTLQLGIGAIPDAVLMFLKDKKDLGIHSEMFSDGLIDLVELGVVNGRQKSLHQGELVATFLMGSQRLYDFVNNNPLVKMYPVNHVNHPCVVMQNHKMVSINSCIEVDLMGQVASESIGLKQFSGVGGQVDFVRGVSMAEGGKSIIATPATAAGGKVSRIVPFLAHGAAVSTSRNDVDYIVTEYGIAPLKGLTLRQRALNLIAIAHPDFRESLMEEFHRRFAPAAAPAGV